MAEKLRILVVEDVATDAELQEQELRRSGLEFTSRRVETRPEFIAAMGEFRPDLILADYRMPAFNGMEALALTFELAPRTPFIIVTGSVNEETAAECIKAGAWDYVLKGHLGRLSAAVGSALERRRVAEERRKAEGALQASERRYKALFEEARDGIFIADADSGVLLDVNRSVLELIGRRHDDMVGVPVFSFVATPGQLDRVKQAWSLTAEGGTAGAIEVDLIRSDGSLVPVEIRGGAFTDADGKRRLVGIVRDTSRRRQEERELRASESRHRALFEDAHDAIVVAEPATGAIVDANRRAVELTGRRLPDLRRMRLFDLHPRDEAEVVRADILAAAQEPGRALPLRHVLRPDGRRTPVEMSVSAIVDADGRPLQVEVLRDVSEREAVVAQLRESEERFRLAVEDAPDGVFVYSDGRFAYLNPAALALFGAASAHQLLDTPVIERIQPRFREAVRERMRVLQQAHRSVPLVEEEFLKLDGTAVHVEVASVPFRFLGRDAVLTFVRDISERKRSEAARDLLGAAVEQAAEVAIVTDTTGTIQYVNPAFERVTGFARAEAVGNNPRILKSGIQGPDVYRQMWETLTSGGVYSGTFVNRKKSGEHYVAEVVISPVRDAAGEVIRYIGLQRDVTHERDLEEQLRQSQKMEAVGLLTGGIAHDFNNLLGIILANASLLKSDLPPERTDLFGYVADLDEAAQHGIAMVKKLLAFGRREKLSPTPLDLAEQLRDFERTARRLIPETIALRVDTPVTGPVAVVDEGALRQILFNLATNARDAMPGGGTLSLGAATIEFREEDESLIQGFEKPGRYACVSVSDTGCGMDKAVLDHVFEPFFTTKPMGAGSGLGLPMVFGLMKQHDGLVHIYSEPGHGTTVRLYFRSTGVPSVRSGRASALGGMPRGTETILVVEDQAMLRRATARALSKLGYQVVAAADGVQGLQVLAEQAGRVALVLSDLVMPEMGGIEMHRRVVEQGVPVKFLFMTGYAAGTPGETLPPGVSIIEKPWTVEALATKLREVLDSPPAS